MFAQNVIICASYAFIGGGLKCIDQIYDLGILNKKIAAFLVLPVGLTMGGNMASDPYSAELLLSIILGTAICSKVDNFPFRAIALIALLVPGIYSLANTSSLESQLRWLSLAILTFAGVLDEYFDNFSETRSKNSASLGFFKVFQYRPILPLVLFLAACIWYFPFIYCLALLAFDLAYLTVAFMSQPIVE